MLKSKFALHLQLSLIFILSIFFSSHAQNLKINGKELHPALSKKIEFGMDLQSFKNILSSEVTQYPTDKFDFRTVLTQDLPLEDLIEVIYYFDNDGNQPLYEIILVFSDQDMALEIGEKLFGKANFEEDEWRLKANKSDELWAWVYKNKLVVVAKIPNTEWDKDWDN